MSVLVGTTQMSLQVSRRCKIIGVVVDSWYTCHFWFLLSLDLSFEMPRSSVVRRPSPHLIYGLNYSLSPSRSRILGSAPAPGKKREREKQAIYEAHSISPFHSTGLFMNNACRPTFGMDAWLSHSACRIDHRPIWKFPKKTEHFFHSPIAFGAGHSLLCHSGPIC